MTQFTKTNIKTFLHKERSYKHIIFMTTTSLLLFIISLAASVHLWSFHIEKAQAKESNVFIYTNEAKKADLEAIKLNRQTYLDKKAIKHTKTKPVRVFNNKKDTIQLKSNEEVIKKAIIYLKKKEGLRFKAYPDFKQWSICYGMKSKKGATATIEQCDKGLEQRVRSEVLRIDRNGGQRLKEGQKIALISFFYNTGYKHYIMMYAKKNDHKSVVYMMNKYIYADGQKKQNLVNRRAEEIAIYQGITFIY